MDSQESHSEQLIELAEEYVELLRIGEQPALSDYAKRYPELAEEIRELFPAMAMMENVAPSEESLGPDARANSDSCDQHLTLIGDFRILRELGRGGMGVVYEAEQLSLGRHVALKVLLRHLTSDASYEQRFEREARAAARLHHTHIVPVYGFGIHEGTYYYAMQYIPGVSLDGVVKELRRASEFPHTPPLENESPVSATQHWLISDGENIPDPTRCDESTPIGPTEGLSVTRTSNLTVPLAGVDELSGIRGDRRVYWRSAARIAKHVAEALEHAHKEGVLHRDIKPANLLLDTSGHVWITDFGLAKSSEGEDLTQTGAVVGTPRYLAPEVFTTEPDGRTDVYALGLTLYELLALQPAFDEKDQNKLLRCVMDGEPPPLRVVAPGVPRDLETIVHRAIERDPTRRYPSAGALADDLDRFLDNRPILARRTTFAERCLRWCKHNPTLAGVLGVLLVLLTTLAIVGPIVAVRQTQLANQAEEKSQLATEEANRRARSEKRLRQTLYCARMKLAQLAWEQADVSRVLELLQGQMPTNDEEDLRGFEWYYWWRLCHRFRTPLEHNDIVWCVAYSPDGARIATASEDGNLALWDAATGKLLAKWKGYSGKARSICFSPEGLALATTGSDGPLSVWSVRLWNVADQKRTATLYGHLRSIPNVVFSPDGQTLASASYDRTVRLWNRSTGKLEHTIAPKTSVERIAFSPDGRTLALACTDKSVQLWKLNAEEPVVLRGHRGSVQAVAFSPDGKTLASGCSQSQIKLWEVASGRPIGGLRGHRFFVTSLAFSPDGATLASGSTDNTTRLWDWKNERERYVLRGHTYLVNSVAFSPDGRWLATASYDRTVKLWETNLGELEAESLLPEHFDRSRSLTFSHEGSKLLVSGINQKVRLIDLSNGQCKDVGPDLQSVSCLAGSPDGELVAWASGDETVNVWDVHARKVVATMKLRLFDTVQGLAFSPDGTMLAAAGKSGAVKLWNRSDWTEKVSLKGHAEAVNGLLFTPDSTRLVSGNSDGSVKIWSTRTGQEQASLTARGSAIGLAVSPDGKILASSHNNRNEEMIILWDLQSGDQIDTLKGHIWVIGSLAFSPDGRTLSSASWDGTVRLWNVSRGEETATLKPQTGKLHAISFSPDGKTLVSGGDTGIKLFRAATTAEVHRQAEEKSDHGYRPRP